MPTGEIGPRPVTTTRDAGANSILVAASHCERLRTKFFLPSLVNAVDSRGMERKRNIEQYIRPPLMVYVGEVITVGIYGVFLSPKLLPTSCYLLLDH